MVTPLPTKTPGSSAATNGKGKANCLLMTNGYLSNSHISLMETVHVEELPSGKLTWQWKITIFNREYIFNRSIFHCHVIHIPTLISSKTCTSQLPTFLYRNHHKETFPQNKNTPPKMPGLWHDVPLLRPYHVNDLAHPVKGSWLGLVKMADTYQSYRFGYKLQEVSCGIWGIQLLHVVFCWFWLKLKQQHDEVWGYVFLVDSFGCFLLRRNLWKHHLLCQPPMISV